MPEPTTAEKKIIHAIAETLHTIADQGDISAAELHIIANQVATTDVADWWTCPLCEETVCDGGCPLAAIRAAELTRSTEGA